jgi:ectoine hydroxylase-related dioxygenase (phytanoyl-CoA dioxygenase family)
MSLSSPAEVMDRLAAIENDLASRQNDLERAALAHFRAKRDREESWARSFIAAEGTVAERKAIADSEHAQHGAIEEASYEAQRSVIRVLETRANIGMAVLKAQGRAA